MDIQSVVASLFPPFVAVAARLVGEVEPHDPEEARAVAGAVTKRQREFFVGRACAHEALRVLGLDQGPLLVGPARAPRWPPGAVGSIAHAGDWSVAVVARAHEAQGLGVDIELLEPPLEVAVDRLVRTDAERAGMASLPQPLARHAAKVAFSAKEAVYKALYPVTGRRLEFTEVEVGFEAEPGAFTAQLNDASVAGRFALTEGYVVSGVWLPPVPGESRSASFQVRNRRWTTPSGPSPSPEPSGKSRNVH